MTESGEGTLLLKQMHELGNAILDNLVKLDQKLKKLQEEIQESDELDREALLQQIADMRALLGSIEKEDAEELRDEEILQRMMKKLNTLIETALGGE